MPLRAALLSNAPSSQTFPFSITLQFQKLFETPILPDERLCEMPQQLLPFGRWSGSSEEVSFRVLFLTATTLLKEKEE